MKKLLMIVGAMLAFNTAHALDLDWQNDVTVSPATLEGNQTFTIGADQDGNKFSIGSHGITLSISDTVDFGLAYSAGLVPGFRAGTYYEYTTNDENILGVVGSAEYYGISLTPTIEWNINQTEFDGTLEGKMALYGLGVFGSVDMNINDFKFTGSEAGVEYVAVLFSTETSSFSVTPSITLPFDDDWESGTLRAGVSVNVLF
jgi:hypothetical protein|tara:strand:+ start:423 stop:1028 length:606 start_codon:yes stop_codon:yes gene_type:complete